MCANDNEASLRALIENGLTLDDAISQFAAHQARAEAGGHWRLPRQLVETIYAEVFRPATTDEAGKLFHYVLQKRMFELGRSLSYKSRMEFPVSWTDAKNSGRIRPGFIDNVWDHPADGRSFAIEIDSSWRYKSLRKLQVISETHQPVFLYYGQGLAPAISGDAEFHRIHILRTQRRDPIERS